MCLVDYCEGKWDQLQLVGRVARKPHLCYECHRTIEPGERYEYGVFATDYGIQTIKTCAHCQAVRSWLVAQCGGWAYGGVLEDLEEHWSESWEVRGRYLARAIAGMRRHWRGGSDRIMGTYRIPAEAVRG